MRVAAILVGLATACGHRVAALAADAGAEPSPWIELTEPGLALTGGAALGGAGGAGGRVVLRSSGAMVVAAHPSAGAPDPVRVITSPSDLVVAERVETLGASLVLRAAGTVYLTGVVDTRGADAGARAGDVSIEADRVVVTGSIIAAGSDARGVGHVIGGCGGTITVTATSAIQLTGTLDVRGGVAVSLIGRATGGDAGVVSLDTAGALQVAAIVDGRGGLSFSHGADAPGAGGAAGTVDVGAAVVPGTLELAGAIVADGGDGGGPGGELFLETRDGDASIVGQLLARGGRGGGRGGKLEVFTDTNFDGIGGDLAIETTGWIDVSGGDGGGAARNNGTGGVAYFPDVHDEIAVLLNSDGMHGSPRDGTLVNRGHIIATGGAPNGWGGDVMFHGRRPGNDEDPLPGELTLDGSGSGHDGDFVPE